MLAPLITTAAGASAFASVVAESEGATYWYGHLDGALPMWPMRRADCSYFALRALQRAGVASHAVAPMRAIDLANRADPVPVGQQAPGDFWFGGSGEAIGHVALVISLPKSSAGGHSDVMGANGGGSSTFGNDPEARVQRETAPYWASGFKCYGRLKSEFRATDADRAVLRALYDIKAGREVAQNVRGAIFRLYGDLLALWGVS